MARSRSDDEDYEDDDKPVESPKMRKKVRPLIPTPLRPVVWAILGLPCCWAGPLAIIIGSMAFYFAKAAEEELPESSRADTARQMMLLCKIAGGIEIGLGVIGTIAGIILTLKGQPK